jgi:hypothetical protein
MKWLAKQALNGSQGATGSFESFDAGAWASLTRKYNAGSFFDNARK